MKLVFWERMIRQSWLFVAMITVAATSISTSQSLTRYHEFRTGWAWDLAYYNQWFWALNFGDGQLTVRPLARYAEEGPSVWKMNYLAPVRLMLAPIYRIFPDPRTLLVIQNIIFWWVIPAAYTLVRSESCSRALAVSAAALVPGTPLLWPLVLNDFRELQLALPFVLWAVQGVRSRSPALATLGIAGMLACRQEFAVMAATFAFIPSRRPEPLSATLRWRHIIVFAGLSWLLFGFLGYLRFMVGRNAPLFYFQQFLEPKAALSGVLHTSLEALVRGVGAWALLACFAPRVAVLALPWIWGPCSGQWSMNIGVDQRLASCALRAANDLARARGGSDRLRANGLLDAQPPQRVRLGRADIRDTSSGGSDRHARDEDAARSHSDSDSGT